MVTFLKLAEILYCASMPPRANSAKGIAAFDIRVKLTSTGEKREIPNAFKINPKIKLIAIGFESIVEKMFGKIREL